MLEYNQDTVEVLRGALYCGMWAMLAMSVAIVWIVTWASRD
jgi:hypothetical protein